MKNKYTANYLLRKFEAIPEEMWTTGSYGNDGGPRCALGHCKAYCDLLEKKGDERSSLRNLFNEHLDGASVAPINDYSYYFPEPTPKQRIMSALTLIAAGVKL